jgi:F-type H+-transporting ATPase subunit epsilon
MENPMADSKRSAGIRCLVVTPETTVLDATAKSVVVPLEDGERGIGKGHAPFIGRLGVGEVRIVSSDGPESVHRTFVEGGFVEVSHDAVTVITQRAVPGSKLDLVRARAELADISAKPAAGTEAIDAKLRAQEAARAIVRIAERVR